MRILLVTPIFPPFNTAASVRLYSFARCWSQAGHSVDVLTIPKLPQWCGLDLPFDGFRVIEVPFRPPMAGRFLWRRPAAAAQASSAHSTPAPSRRGFKARLADWLKRKRVSAGIYYWNRKPDYTDGWVKPAVRWCRRQPPWDLVVSSFGPYTSHRVAHAIRRVGHASRWVADYRDLWNESHLFRGLFPFTLQERYLERRWLATTDAIVTVSEGLASVLRGKASAPVSVIMNGYDEEQLAGVSPERLLPEEGPARLAYTGVIYPPDQNPQPLLSAMNTLGQQEPGAADRLRLITAGATEDRWKHQVELAGAGQMWQSLGSISHQDALRLQRDSDALLLFDWSGKYAGVLTTKLFEYLRGTRPILVMGCDGESELAGLVRRCNRGLVLGNDVGAIHDVLRRLLRGEPLLEGSPNESLIASLSRRQQAMRMLEHVMLPLVMSESQGSSAESGS